MTAARQKGAKSIKTGFFVSDRLINVKKCVAYYRNLEQKINKVE